MRFYYTFGTSPTQPYMGGWVEVIADNRSEANAKFRTKFPDKDNDILNCAFIYDEDRWINTDMYHEGNLGARCHEVIT